MNKLLKISLLSALLFTYNLALAEEAKEAPKKVETAATEKASDKKAKYKLTQIGSGYNNVTQFSSTICGSPETYVALREGKIYSISDDINKAALILDISEKVLPGENAGLLGFAFHPDFEKNNKFYVHYISKGKDVEHVISQFTYSSGAQAGEEIKILTFPVSEPVYNSGGQLIFGHDEMLYIGIGDNSKENDAVNTGQNNFDVYGSVLRIKVDPEGISSKAYIVPRDNPFYNNSKGNEIAYTYGLRNPKTFTIDSLKHTIYVSDDGSGISLEIDKVLSGKNYGWSLFDGNDCMVMKFECLGKDVEPPLFTLANKNNSEIILGTVYYGTKLTNLIGNLIFADKMNKKIYSLNPDEAAKSEVILEAGFPIVAITSDNNSDIIVALSSGEIFKIE